MHMFAISGLLAPSHSLNQWMNVTRDGFKLKFKYKIYFQKMRLMFVESSSVDFQFLGEPSGGTARIHLQYWLLYPATSKKSAKQITGICCGSTHFKLGDLKSHSIHCYNSCVSFNKNTCNIHPYRCPHNWPISMIRATYGGVYCAVLSLTYFFYHCCSSVVCCLCYTLDIIPGSVHHTMRHHEVV